MAKKEPKDFWDGKFHWDFPVPTVHHMERIALWWDEDGEPQWACHPSYAKDARQWFLDYLARAKARGFI